MLRGLQPLTLTAAPSVVTTSSQPFMARWAPPWTWKPVAKWRLQRWHSSLVAGESTAGGAAPVMRTALSATVAPGLTDAPGSTRISGCVGRGTRDVGRGARWGVLGVLVV